MKKPLISVVMTVYNCEKFIKDSLDSIFNQSFKDFEFVIYNDASTDRTWSIMEDTIKKFDIKCITINRLIGGNIGCANGRNKAIEKAVGKYIAVQDGDDISDIYRLEKEVKLLEDNDDLFCVGSWANLIDEKGCSIGFLDYPEKYHNDIVNMLFAGINPIIDPSAMFRRDVFYKLGGYDLCWVCLVPDLHLWAKAILEGHHFANIQDRLVHHRQHKNSLMSRYMMEAVTQHKILHNRMLKDVKKEVFLI